MVYFKCLYSIALFNNIDANRHAKNKTDNYLLNGNNTKKHLKRYTVELRL